MSGAGGGNSCSTAGPAAPVRQNMPSLHSLPGCLPCPALPCPHLHPVGGGAAVGPCPELYHLCLWCHPAARSRRSCCGCCCSGCCRCGQAHGRPQLIRHRPPALFGEPVVVVLSSIRRSVLFPSRGRRAAPAGRSRCGGGGWARRGGGGSRALRGRLQFVRLLPAALLGAAVVEVFAAVGGGVLSPVRLGAGKAAGGRPTKAAARGGAAGARAAWEAACCCRGRHKAAGALGAAAKGRRCCRAAAHGRIDAGRCFACRHCRRRSWRARRCGAGVLQGWKGRKQHREQASHSVLAPAILPGPQTRCTDNHNWCRGCLQHRPATPAGGTTAAPAATHRRRRDYGRAGGRTARSCNQGHGGDTIRCELLPGVHPAAACCHGPLPPSRTAPFIHAGRTASLPRPAISAP
jgi:hypothetical protein